MRTTKTKRLKRPEPKYHDILSEDCIAPDYFWVNADASEFTRRVKAFVRTMDSLNRVVMIRLDEDDNELYLTSHPQQILLDPEATDGEV